MLLSSARFNGIDQLPRRNPRATRLARAVVAIASCVLAFLGCTEEPPLGEGHYRWEGIRGFAIWPEDQPEDGLAACEEADDDSWRRDPGTAAEEFVRSVLNWNDPPDLTDHEVPQDAPRAAFTITDGSMPDDALGVVVHLRQLRGCWFVAVVWPREGDAGGTYDWVKKGGDWVLRASWDGREPINLEVGWGDTIERVELERGDEVDLPIPDPEMSGHILWFYDEPSEHTFGQPLSPPPRMP